MTTAFANDLFVADLVYGICAKLTPASPISSGKPATRYGDRKCFISAVWQVLSASHAMRLADLEIETMTHFKIWLLEAMRLRAADGTPLILLARADLVGAMDRDAVRLSEVSDRGADFHFIIDRKAGADEYLALKS